MAYRDRKITLTLIGQLRTTVSYTVEGEDQPQRLSSDLRMCIMSRPQHTHHKDKANHSHGEAVKSMVFSLGNNHTGVIEMPSDLKGSGTQVSTLDDTCTLWLVFTRPCILPAPTS